MRILLTGSNGYIGKNLKAEILKRGHVIKELSKDDHNIRNPLNTDEIFDVVIHTAANPSAKSCIENPESAVFDNIVGTFNVIEYARKINALFVFFSSCEVYGKCDDNTTEESELKSFNMYGASKISCEHMCQAYHHSYGLRCIIFRLLHTWGPHCQKERFSSIIQDRLKNETSPHFVFHNKDKKRWLNVEVMSERVLTVIENFTENFDVFNLVGDENLTLEDFAKLFGKHFTFEYSNLNINGYQTTSNADGSKLKKFIDSISVSN